MMSDRDRDLLRQIRVDRFVNDAVGETDQKARPRERASVDDIAQSPEEYVSAVKKNYLDQEKIQLKRTDPIAGRNRTNSGGGLFGIIALALIGGFLWFFGVTVYKIFTYGDVNGAFEKGSSIIECAMSPTCTKVPLGK
jgi:hypothetical protein